MKNVLLVLCGIALGAILGMRWEISMVAAQRTPDRFQPVSYSGISEGLTLYRDSATSACFVVAKTQSGVAVTMAPPESCR
jgi:hypothetical protein